MNIHKLQQDAFKIYKAGVQAVSPCKLISDSLKVSRDKLVIQDTEYQLRHNVHVVAFGKAVLGMVQAVESILGSHIVQGVVSVPSGAHMVQTCQVCTIFIFSSQLSAITFQCFACSAD
jgi:glycerate-2-kinase